MPEEPMSLDTTDAGTKDSTFAAPQINLPKGGGAIRGIDEKFTSNPVTGTGSLRVPLPVTSGRSGFGPQLSLNYDSGSGNGIFGIGWSLSLPSIVRRTDKGLPQYQDAEESDIFILSDAEDLVPVLLSDEDGTSRFDEFERDGYRVKRYRPRIEGLFARIERWTRLDSGETHWRSLSKENVLTFYGLDPDSRIADPEGINHVFQWLICRSYDDKGNGICYDYAAENDRGVDLSMDNERCRSRNANRHPKRIRYGNRVPVLLDAERPSFRCSHLSAGHLDSAEWMFEFVFDYGEGRYREEQTDAGRMANIETGSDWPARKDPFSSYRSGFEIRTHRLCRRVLMIHHFRQELGTASCLIRSATFDYREKALGSFLERIIQSGHRLTEDGRYLTRSLPPLELAYTTSPLEDPVFHEYGVEEVAQTDLANLPGSIDGEAYRWADLDGEGIAGVLSEQGGSWFYKPNLGGGRFGAVETVPARPSLAALGSGRQQLMDIAGDGNLDLVDLSVQVSGFYERTLDAGWAGFRPFQSLPVTDWNDPNLRFVDVTGDGIADVLITEDDALIWHPSLLRKGFGTAIRVPVPFDEAKGPRVIFADSTQSIYLADMSGDGLSDLVRIRNGEVCYWPNRGYGRFGARVSMERSPWFDEPELFDQKRIRLADTDGSGTSDIIYLGAGGVTVYLNESGNSWSEARHLWFFPAVDTAASITAMDFLGRGTACLVWSSPLPVYSGRQMQYVDLMCGRKPHLLHRVVNNLGAETRIDYASSTDFYLADKAAGSPWVTRLPFPVHVVRRVETYDFVSRNRFVTRYSYHHGYYDGVEREFRGFGRVDQFDTEEMAALTNSRNFPQGDNVYAASAVPPVLTRTWFHTGLYLEGRRVTRHLEHEYYREGLPRNGESRLPSELIGSMLLDDTILPEHLTAEEAREACRSLKGSMLRQEVYAEDGTDESRRPYVVTEGNFTIRTLQRRGPNLHAVFFTHSREQVGFHYERRLYKVHGFRRADPRVTHNLTLEVDDYGNVLRSIAIGYGRRYPDTSPMLTDGDRNKQSHILLTLTESDYTNAVEEADAYRTPLPAEQRLYELVKLVPRSDSPEITNLFRFHELVGKADRASDGLHELPYGDWQALGAVENAPYRRLLKKSRSVYRDNRLGHLLPLGRLESLALPGQSHQLALTSEILNEVYRRGEARENLLVHRDHVLRDEGGYVDLDQDGNWWVPSSRVFFSEEEGHERELAYALSHFFLPHRYRDPFGNITRVRFDPHDLAPIEITDAVGNTARAEFDYRVIAPRLLTDPNGNRTEVAFDALGRVAGTAVMGKTGEAIGDSLRGFEPDLSAHRLRAFLEDPRGSALALLADATTRTVYDVERYFHSQRPVFAATIARETHVLDLRPGERSKTQISFGYSDGFAREIQKKLQAEPGPLTEGGDLADPRWIGSGWTIYNNKGKPVRKYEPFFSATFDFEFNAIHGVSPTLFYDPVDRVVATVHPEHNYEKVVFDPWQQATWDANDTVIYDPGTDPDVREFLARLPHSEYLPTWYQQRIGGAKGPAERTAAEKSSRHADTPTIAYFDSLGRIFLSITDNGAAEKEDGSAGRHRKYPTRTELDIEGNPRAVIDPLNRTVMLYEYDMRSTRLHQSSMEGGKGWMLNDIAGKPIRAWNSRRYAFRTEYDALRRPVRSHVQGGDPYERGARTYPREILFERTIYGDSPETGLTEHHQREDNLRGRLYQHFDTAGVFTTAPYDFKGNLLHSYRQFARNYRNIPDWGEENPLEAEIFAHHTTYDALNRVVTFSTPDRSVYQPGYNETNLLEKIDVALRGEHREEHHVWTPFVTNIDYNARAQRTRLCYANRAATTYEYDQKTFRLMRLRTDRSRDRDDRSTRIFADASRIQDLHYTFDSVGNITEIADTALRTVLHDNRKVDSVCRYIYDALYRLIEASGRENKVESAFEFIPARGNYRDYPFTGAERLGDPEALENYTERYEYDPVGNFLRMIHRAEHRNWTRHYTYDEESQLQPEKKSNRLSRTHLQSTGHPVSEPYLYDAHGNMIQMPHLPVIHWDFQDRLGASSRQVIRDGTPETTFYVYDGSGQRVRKVTEHVSGSRKNECLYVPGLDVFREFGSDGRVVLERETLHVMDDQRRVALVETLTRALEHPLLSLEPRQRFQLANHLGSTCLELDPTAALISYEEYSPYGETTYQVAKSRAEAKLKRYRYTGKERDDENGFSYHGARYYAPWLGRWTAIDAHGTGARSLYVYAGANPVVAVDNTGYDDEKLVDPSDEYGGTLPPGGAPPPTTQDSGATASNAGESTDVYPADFIGPLPLGATRAPAPSPEGTVATVSKTADDAQDTADDAQDAAGYYLSDSTYRAMGLTAAFVEGGTTGVLDYLHAEANTRPDAGVEPQELPPGGTDYSGGAEGGLLSDPAMRMLTGVAVDIMASEALEKISPFGGKSGSRTGLVSEPVEREFVKPAQFSSELTPKEQWAWEVSNEVGGEFSMTNNGNPSSLNPPHPTRSSIGVGPDVNVTAHTHPTSGVAMPSETDIKVFADPRYAPGTQHRVIGSAWPHTNAELRALGLDIELTPKVGIITTEQARALDLLDRSNWYVFRTGH
jgi:RHS repeat-associated protein